MSKSLAIESYLEINLKWKHLDALSVDQKAALAIVCFAVTEVNSLSRLYLFSQHPHAGEDAIDFAIMAQTNSLLRSWSAKLFEFSDFLTFKDRSNRTDDEKIRKIAAESLEDFAKLLEGNGYNTARALRHEATNHYLLGPVRKNLPYVSESATTTFFLHRKNGSSVYPIGDEVVFAARLNRIGASFDTYEQRVALYKEWFDWNLAATKWLHAVHLRFFVDLVKPILLRNGIASRRRDYWIDPSLVGSIDGPRIPIFFRGTE